MNKESKLYKFLTKDRQDEVIILTNFGLGIIIGVALAAPYPVSTPVMKTFAVIATLVIVIGECVLWISKRVKQAKKAPEA